MKNKHGWSLQLMMVFIMILMIMLVIIAALVKSNFSNLFKLDYNEIEKKVIVATEKYYEKADFKISEGEQLSVTVEQLEKEGLLDIKCSGYGIIEKANNDYKYYAYIKCDEYTTDGYLRYLDSK